MSERSSESRERVGADERLLALVHALVDPGLRLTRRDIRAHVPGYDQENDSSFERMFERDKDMLREWHLPLVTSGESHETVYRIDLESWDTQDVHVTPLELGVLGLAARAWNSAHQQHAASELATAARHATTKLAGRATGAPEPPPADLSVHLVSPGPAYLPLALAVDERRTVTFTYRAASTGSTQRRRVRPWRLVREGRAWYLVGEDLERDAPRAFRLSRILDHVRLVGERRAFTPPDLDDGALRTLVRPEHAHTPGARVAVLPERAHALRARAVRVEPPSASSGPLADRDVLTLPPAERTALADELAALGEGALVLEPADLREAVVTRLRAVTALDRP